MLSEQSPPAHPFCLPPGTVVEDWRLEACRGYGASGIVYRAFRVGQESLGPVALKMALYPWDPRFMREVALLSLVHHPSVPRLLGQGFCRHPSGTVFPFVVLEWIEGVPLYQWGREHRPTQRQVLQALAQLAGALQATHAAGGLHRDVKGDNVLVRSSDGRAMLTDFGAGHYRAAPRLTWQPMPPGTPEYQSPESGLFELRSVSSPGTHYIATPADDVFALGVTAYRLVTGEYPSAVMPQRDAEGCWHMAEVCLKPPSEFNPQWEPPLSALILRMLSLEPGARGTAGELAQVLERWVGDSAEKVAPPVADVEPPPVVEPPVAVEPVRPRGRVRAAVAGSAAMLGAVLLVLWAGWGGQVLPGRVSSEEQMAAGPADLGDKAAAAPLASVQEPSKKEAIVQEPLPEPLPGQIRPDTKGRCPGSKQVAINGGCWVESPAASAGECEQNSLVFFKSRCYAPAMKSRSKPPPTSDLPQ